MRMIDADRLTQDIWDSGITNRDEFENLVRNAKTIEREEVTKSLFPLKLCPFCGNRAVFEFKDFPSARCVSIVCEVCGCQTKLFNDYSDPNIENPNSKAIVKAAKAWNRRKYTS